MDATLLIEEIRKIATELPDYVYHSGGCPYRPKDSPGREYGCIVGYAARRIGESLDHWGSESVCSLVNHGYIAATDEQALWLTRVQVRQDDRVPWGDCVRFADDEIL